MRTGRVLVGARDPAHTATRVRTILERLAGAIHVSPGVRITLRSDLTAVGQRRGLSRLSAPAIEAVTLKA